jgi:hypothetical protein
MTTKGAKLGRSTLLCATFAVLATTVSAQTLPPDAAAKAKDFKIADSQYVKALCDGSKSERSAALAIRTRAKDDLEKVVVDAAAQAPEVQKALDAAADAGEAADKIAADPAATDRDKSAAKDKYEQAKVDLRQILANARSAIEAKVRQDFGINFEAAASDCPNAPKAVEHRNAAPARSLRASGDGSRQVREQSGGSASGPPLPAIGGSGLGISVGGFGIVIGR